MFEVTDAVYSAAGRRRRAPAPSGAASGSGRRGRRCSDASRCRAASAMSSRMRAWIAGGPATMSPDVSHARSSPCQSVTTPPASRTMTPPAATSQVPSCLLEVAVEHARGGPREVEARGTRRAGGPRTRASARSNTGRYSSSRSRLARNGKPVAGIAARDRTRRLTWIGAPSRNAPPPRRAEYRSPSIGACDDADDRLAADDEADRHADHREAVQEVRGAVERVDEPADLGALAAALLAEERDLGRRARQRRRGSSCSLATSASLTSRPGPSRGRSAGAPNAVAHDRAAGVARRRPRRRAARSRSRSGPASRATSGEQRVEQLGRAGARPAVAGRRARRPRARGRRASATSAPLSRQTSKPTEVVPRAVLVVRSSRGSRRVPGGDVAQRERRRARASGTGATAVRRGGSPMIATTARSSSVIADGWSALAVDPCALARGSRCSARRSRRSRRSAHERAVGIERAQRDRPVRDAAGSSSWIRRPGRARR